MIKKITKAKAEKKVVIDAPVTCPTCNGTGRDKPESTCPACNGTGKTS